MESSKEIADPQRREDVVTRSHFENRQAIREQLNNKRSQRSDHDVSDGDFEPSQINSEIYSEGRAEEVNSANETKRLPKKVKVVKSRKESSDSTENIATNSQSENRDAVFDQLNDNISQRSDDDMSNNDSQINSEINEDTAKKKNLSQEVNNVNEINVTEKKKKRQTSKATDYAKPDANIVTITITVKTLQMSRSKPNTLSMSQAIVAVITSEVVQDINLFDETSLSPLVEVPAWFVYNTLCDGLSVIHEKLDENAVSGLPGIWDVSQIYKRLYRHINYDIYYCHLFFSRLMSQPELLSVLKLVIA